MLLRFSGLFCLLALPALAQEGPSYDCTKAASQVEHAICENYLLAQQDFWLASIYSHLRKTLPSGDSEVLKANQKAWIKQRNACETAAVTGDETPEGARYGCLDEIYRVRLLELSGRLEEQEQGVAPGEGLTGAYGYENQGDWGNLLLVQLPQDAIGFWISTVSGPTFHTCELGGSDAKRGNDMALWQSPDEPACKVTIAQDAPERVTVTSIACTYYCGARGYFDATYERIAGE